MFWKFNVLNSPIDTLLDKEDITLRQILDEDDVLQECRAQNKKLLDFLIRPEHILDLVNMVIDEPDPSLDDKCKYKYPNISCEVLTSEVSEITDKLANEEVLLNKVYGFLESEGPLNPLQASFFSKVMSLLIARKSEVMLEFLQNKDDFLGRLLHHIGVSAIMDLLLRLVTCMQSADCRLRCIKWLNEEKLIPRLLGMIDPTQSDEKHSNASQALCDMIVLSREHMSEMQERADNDPLLQSIESKENITSLLEHMLDGAEKSESVLVNGINVIQTLLEFRKVGPEGSTEKMTALDAERLAHGVRNTIDAVVPRLRDFKQVLMQPPKQHYAPMPTTIGALDPPLGNSRLQIVHLVASLLLTNTPAVNQELCNIEIIPTIFDLFFKYTWCNFLHSQVEICLTAILTNPPCVVDNKDEHPLLDQLFKKNRILHLVIDAFNDNQQQQSQPSGRRRGFMGHLIKIANSINEQMENGFNSDKAKGLVSEYDDDIKTRWEKFVSGPLADENKQNSLDKCGPFASTSDDEDFRDIPFPQDIVSFGFKEDSFSDRLPNVNFDFNVDDALEQNSQAEAMFDQACSTRMQEGDDEEDMWVSKDIVFGDSSTTKPSEKPSADLSAVQGTAPDSKRDDDEDDEWGFTEPVVAKSRGHMAASATTFTPSTLADAFAPVSPRPASGIARNPASTPTRIPASARAYRPQVPTSSSVPFLHNQPPLPRGEPPPKTEPSPPTDEDEWETREITFSPSPQGSNYGVSSTTQNAGQAGNGSGSDSDEGSPLPNKIYPIKQGKNKTERMEVDAFDNLNFAMDTLDSSSQGAIEMDTSPWDNPLNSNANNQGQEEGWANFGNFESAPASSEQVGNFADFSSMEAVPAEASADVEMEVKPCKVSDMSEDSVVDSTTKSAGGDADVASSSEDPIVLPKRLQDNVAEEPSSSSDSAPPEAVIDSNSNEAVVDVSTSEAAAATTVTAVCNNMPNDNHVLQDHQEEKSNEDLADNFNFLSGIMGQGADEQVSSSDQQDIERLRAQAKAAMEEFTGATSSTTPD